MKVKSSENQKGLDILVNVAGHQQARKAISEITTKQFDETFKTNVHAML
jgi:NAD(P)-dependent dehydrogenase (short-subunit alcohol dehydrogenase family)